jgi:hypothetical protein
MLMAAEPSVRPKRITSSLQQAMDCLPLRNDEINCPNSVPMPTRPMSSDWTTNVIDHPGRR